MAANEATCLGLAAACGLAAAKAKLLDVAGLGVLAVRRYDRQDPPAGHLPVRIHQEDGCQATATPPGLKYEEQGGPALRDLASLLRNFGDPRDVTGLLRRTTFSMAVGTHLGQRVGGQADLRKVTAASLIDEAAAWGIRRRTAAGVVTETLDRVLTAIPAAPGDERVLAVIRGQAERIVRG